MERELYEQKLKNIFHIEHFYDEQWKAISRILKGERILMIQRTGFGKSLCYQFPATQFDGLTVVFPPVEIHFLEVFEAEQKQLRTKK